MGKSILINMGLGLNLTEQDREMLTLNSDVIVNGGDVRTTEGFKTIQKRPESKDKTSPSEKTGTRPHNFKDETNPHVEIVVDDQDKTQPAIKILPTSETTPELEVYTEEFWDWISSNKFKWNKFSRNGLLSQINRSLNNENNQSQITSENPADLF